MTGDRLVAVLRQEARRVATMPARLRRSGLTSSAALGGDRYSRRVALLKRVLPAAGLSLLLLVAAWPRLAPLIDIHIPGIDLRGARELTMVNPRYAGRDRLNRPYVVTAATGRQVPDRRDLIALDQPRGRLVLRHGAVVTLSAATGVYQSQAQLLDLTKDVDLTRQDGTRFVTASAHINLADDSAEGHDPVIGHGPSGDISAQGFRILSRGDVVIFTGNSKVRLVGGRRSAVATAPPKLPAAIDQAAATLAAEAAATAARRATKAVAEPAHHAAHHRHVAAKRVHKPRHAAHRSRSRSHKKTVHHRRPAHHRRTPHHRRSAHHRRARHPTKRSTKERRHER